MAQARKLDKRRKSIRNIRKITRTMELIATARFQQTLTRAQAATAFTRRITQLVRDLVDSGQDLSHPLLTHRDKCDSALLLVLTANRGMCGGFNTNVIRAALQRRQELTEQGIQLSLEVSGRRGIAGLRFRKVPIDEQFTHFEDKPTFEEVDVLARRYLETYITGRIDRLDVAYTKFLGHSKQEVVVETLLPLGSLDDEAPHGKDEPAAAPAIYELLPSAEEIVDLVVPTSFKVRLLKCFLDSAVSEQTARMVAMKSATENADDMIRHLSMVYNRSRQTQITNEIMEIIGGVEALSGANE